MKEPWYKSPAVFILGFIAAMAVGVSAFSDGTVQQNQVQEPSSVQQDPVTSPTPEVPSATETQQQEVQPVQETQIETQQKAQINNSVEPTQNTEPRSDCNPNYSGCLKRNAGDYDCLGGTGNGPNYTGPVQVLGIDEYALDRDHDGWACEKN